MTKLGLLIVLCITSCGKSVSREKTCNDFSARVREARETLRHVWSDRDGGYEAKWKADLADWKAKADAVRGFELPGGAFFGGFDRDRGPWLDAGAAIVHDAELMRAANECVPSATTTCHDVRSALPSAATIQQHNDVVDREIAVLTPETCRGR